MYRVYFLAIVGLLALINCTPPLNEDAGVEPADASNADVVNLDARNIDALRIDVRNDDATLTSDVTPDVVALDVQALDVTSDVVSLDVRVLDVARADANIPDAERVIIDPFEEPIVVETLSEQFRFIEGPVWRPALQELIFCDINPRTLFRFKEGEGITLFKSDIDCNGSVVQGTGLLTAGAAARDLKSIAADGTVQSRALLYQGEELNSPNDLFLRNGTAYFTDPGYGVAENERGVDFNGVYRLSPNGTLTLMDDLNRQRPNGILLSADGNTAYLSSTEETSVYRYAINANGNFEDPEVHGSVATGGDGVALDEVGNLYVTTSAGVEVISPQGISLGTIELPLAPANCTFGGNDLKDLFITARTTLYRVRLPIAGLPPSQ